MRRLYFILAITLAIFFGSLVAVGATSRNRDEQLRGYVDAAQTADLPYWMPCLGVNAELEQYTPETLNEQLGLMSAAHIVWVRQTFYWDEIEPAAGEYDWTNPDAIVRAFADRSDLRLVAVLNHSPAWARTNAPDATKTAPPHDPAAFAAFASDFAERYGATIDHYQIWDEPNLSAAWGGLPPRPADYAALLSAGYTAIHGADAQAMVIAAALAPTSELGPQNISDPLFLRDLYAFGASAFTDAVAAKPYGFDASPQDRTIDTETLNFSRIVLLREEMVRSGDGTTPLWASNWGWNSLPDDWNGDASIWGSVSADQQIAFTLDALDRAKQEMPWLSAMIVYEWQPDAPPDSARWGFALIDQRDRPTPLYEALAARPTSESATNGLYFATNPFTQFSGVWSFGNLGADIGWLQDSQFSFDFSGRDVSLLLRQDNYAAFLYPIVDGQPANALPRDAAGNAFINLESGSHEPELTLVPIARNLSSAEHTLRVIADRGWDRWALAGIAVGSGNLAAPYEQQVSIAILTTVVAGLASFATALQIDWRPLARRTSALWMRLGDVGQLAASAVTSIALLIGMLLTWGDAVPALFRREPVQLGLAIITAGLLYIEPGAVLALLAAALLFVIFYHRVEYGLILTLFYAPFFMFPVELFIFSFPMPELLMLITAAAWLLRQLVNWGRSRQSSNTGFPSIPFYHQLYKLNTLDWGVLAWVLLGVASLAWADYRGFAVTELRTMILEPAVFYLILRTLPFNRLTTQRLIDALLLAGFVVCVIGLFQYSRGDAIITAEDGARRLASVYGSPNNVGLLLGRCIPFLLVFTLRPLDQRRRVISGIILAVMLITLVLTQSAGAMFLGAPLGIATVLLLLYGKRGLFALIGLGVVGGAGFFALTQISARFSRVLDLTEGTSFFRLRVWQSTVQMLRDHPITGMGLDQFLYAYRGEYLLPDAWQEPNLSHPHNILLDWWVRLGFFGLLLLLWIQVAFWRTTLRLYRAYRQTDRYLFAIVVGIMGSMAALLAHGMIDNSVYVQDLAYLFVLLLALTAQLAHDNGATQPTSVPE